jgi:peptidyl-prolyl cis-trans isomerase SurA
VVYLLVVIEMFRQMMASRFVQSTAILILSGALGSVPSLAQATNPKASSVAPATPPAASKVVEDIVARVNDQIITQSDYDRAAEQLEAEGRQQSVPAQQLAQKKADLLRDLIDQQLLLSKGKELGVTGETELIKRLDEIRKQNHLDSLEDLEKAAQQQGVSYEDFKASIRNGIITQEVVRNEVGRRITMSPSDAQNYFKAHESEFAQPESVTLNEILIPTPAKAATEGTDAPEVAAAKAQADAIVAKLASGAKFDDLAKPNPTDPNAPKSVPLGEFKRGMLAKEIEDKAFALNAGQYTQPIRTKQGFIILQATEHNAGGEASFKQVEPQVEEALFLERMQPKLRQYLTELREQAYVELKPGVVDTGSSGNEMRLTYSAYAPPPEKKKKKFVRSRFRGRKTSAPAQTTQTASTAPAAAGAAKGSNPATAAATPAPSSAGANALAPTSASPATASANKTQTASNNNQGVEKPGKKEKIRFGQAPRESLPANSQVASASTPDNTPGVTTPETRYVNPDGTLASATNAAPEKKTRLASRPVVKKPKTPKPGADTQNQPTAEELASQKVQNAPLGLAGDSANKKKSKQKGDKTRIEERPKEPDQTPAPYLGKPEPAETAPATGKPAGSSAPTSNAPASSSAPASGAPAAQPPGTPQP